MSVNNEFDYGVLELGALIRGLSFDREKGAFVRFSPGFFPEGEGVITLPAGDFDEQKESLKSVFGLFDTAGKTMPCAVSVPAEGTFVLGTSFDEAGAESETTHKVPTSFAPLPVIPASGRRADTVLNKIAAVTGGAQGFGAGIARRLAEEGAFVYILDMNIEGAEALVSELNSTAGKTTAMALEVNVTSEESVFKMTSEILKNTGGLDLFVNNAGVLKAGSVKTLTLKDFNFVTSVNYTGYFICTKFVSAIMAKQNAMAEGYYTDIVQINSKSGLEGSNKNGAYAGGKFGGIGLTQSFALELVEDRIKVNSICPGNFFDGPLWSDPDRGLFVQYLNSGKVPGAKTIEDVKSFYEAKVPMKRGCYEDDVVKAILYVSEQKYETGQAVPVTGGQIMLN
ncbi:MAG: SDR family NAD(P)-dependent oxidoreductase [Spirochaetales bacterium]|nr:SDR family NAD(P)-dependent oxidoreductase [Spirochaetales bacterium]